MGNSSGSETYYTSLAKEDYYLEGGEPPGQWFGKGAEILALSGMVDDETFKHLFRGFSPKGQGKLVQNAGADNRRPGYDLTFSAPKTVSVFWSQANRQTRQIVQQAQQKAVETALNYLEEQTITRMGKGGHQHVPAKLVVGMFEHGTSRALDPQLHTHALVFNVAVRPDGSTGTIENNSLYRNKMLAGAIYRAELAKELQQQLGLRAERVKSWFEIKGIDKGLIEEFSKRRQAIEDYLEKNNLNSAKASEVAALKTRDVKGYAAREELFEQWQRVGESYHYQAPTQSYVTVPENTSVMLSQQALGEIMENNAHFTKRELLTKTAIMATPFALSWDEIQQGVGECLQQLAQLIEKTTQTGSKLVLVGDHRQLQPIGAGGAKRKLMKLLGYAQLNNITRQQEEWAREAVKNIADGKAQQALKEHLDRGLVHIAETSETAKDKLMKDWAKYGLSKPHNHLILAAYRDDVFHLNRLAQLSRKDAGLLGRDNLRVKGQKMYVGDRIVFTRNDRHHGVKNGQFGTVKDIKGKKMTVKLDDGSQKTIHTKACEHIQLGYASTTHKAQGETRYNTYVLMGGDMQDLELSYVQLSRAKYKTRVYAEALEDTNQTVRQLVTEMKRSRQKQMAVHYGRGKNYEMEV